MTFKEYNNGFDHSKDVYNDNLILTKKSITSLKGCFNEIKGNFDCSSNEFKNLVGGPTQVYGYYSCGFNDKLVSLEGAPTYVETLFNCAKSPNLKNPKEQILKYKIKATMYFTDEGNFYYDDIKDEFEQYQKNQIVKRKGFRTLLGLNK